MYLQKLLLPLINAFFTVVESLILLRIMLKLFGASASAPFVQWMYATTDPLLYPFLGMFPSPILTGGFVIEFSAFFGLVVYALLGYAISEIIATIAYRAELRERGRKEKA